MDDNIFKNIKTNLTAKQKIAIGLFFVIIAILLVVLAALIMDTETPDGDGGETDEEIEIVEEVYTDDRGVTFDVTTETITNDDGETITTSTKEDEYGNTTTLDPNLITTYFPYQVMREHSDEEPTLRYFVWIDEDNLGFINALVEDCDEAEDRRLVREYIKSIPLDLSKYEIKFETFSEDVICEY